MNMIEYDLPDAKWPNVDLVGEFYRRESIVAQIGGMPRGDEPAQADVKVHLVPEPDNPHSKSGHAISARVNGVLVGYLGEGDSARWHRVIERITASGAVVTTPGNVYAYNRTKWDDHGRTFNDLQVNVRVALPDPSMMAPLNNTPTHELAVLPWGNLLQVTGEENHFSHLFEYVPPSGQGLVLLTMHRIEHVLKSGAIREVAEVRLDGERVGQLTAASSQHFLPSIRHAIDVGKELGVWSKLKGSGLAVELTVHGAKATEIPDSWLKEMAGVPTLIPEADSYDVPNAYIPESTRAASRKASPAINNAAALAPETSAGSGQASGLLSKAGIISAKHGDSVIVVGKKKIVINDQIRQASPKKWRFLAALSLVAGVLFGSLLAGIPGIGPVLCLAVLGLGIYLFVYQRRIAAALEQEQLQRGMTIGWRLES